MRGGQQAQPGSQGEITGLPLTLDRLNVNFTGFNTSIATVFEDLYRFQNPSGLIWRFKKGTPFFIDIFDVVPARITVGTYRLVMQDPGQVKTVELWRNPMTVFNNYSDVRLRPSYPNGFLIKPGEFLIVQINSATAAIQANGDTTLNGDQISANLI